MAVVISGVNNNDKITASDGTIDLVSGVNFAGIVTASTFSAGNLTSGHINIGSNIQLGNAGVATATTFVGNLTGNVNATSNLLLQIGGSEKFRVGSSGQLGIGGANYGTSGQVLTSGGSGSAANWSNISGTTINNNATTKFITGTNNENELDCEANLSYNNSLVTFSNSGLMVDKSANATISAKETTGNKEVQFRANTDGGLIRTVGNYPLILGVNQVEKVRITNSGDVRITGDFNCLTDNKGIYFGNSNQLRILGLDNGDSIIDAVSGTCKLQDNGSGSISFGGGSVQVYQKLNVDYSVSGSDYVAYFRNQNANSYGVAIQEPSSVNTGYPLLSCTNSSGQSHFRVDTAGLVYANSGAGTDKKAYFVRAWVNFNGNNSSIRGSGNVSSITDNGTGDFTVNFSSSMPDTNFCVMGTTDNWEGTNSDSGGLFYGQSNSPLYTGGYRLVSVRARFDQQPPQRRDFGNTMVSFIR